VLAGLAVGIPLALLATRLLRSLLYEVSASDPVTFFGVAALLAGVALVASWIPARRAARVDPAVALRAD
jgi:ABC-type lipoprotein release transport system permease subunit